MDPNKVLKQIEDSMSHYLEHGQQSQLNTACWVLYNWMSKKGFDPDWQKYPQAMAFYNGWYVRGQMEGIFGSD